MLQGNPVEAVVVWPLTKNRTHVLDLLKEPNELAHRFITMLATLYSPKQLSVFMKQADLCSSGFSSQVRNSSKNKTVQWLDHY